MPDLFRPKGCRFRWHHLGAIHWTPHPPSRYILYMLVNTSKHPQSSKATVVLYRCRFRCIKAEIRAGGLCSGVVKWRGGRTNSLALLYVRESAKIQDWKLSSFAGELIKSDVKSHHKQDIQKKSNFHLKGLFMVRFLSLPPGITMALGFIFAFWAQPQAVSLFCWGGMRNSMWLYTDPQ